ncbi:hypothetical protein A0H81_09435 [Grifola frondosa]|uniref:Alpha/beta-hydrolase n=1 Tax=Grifola frondosa TaxID=5627 RepID=A0A1C7M1E5_GRIFR|nr:hypothetical protein A0H81_09435 [Grifola frondosa]
MEALDMKLEMSSILPNVAHVPQNHSPRFPTRRRLLFLSLTVLSALLWLACCGPRRLLNSSGLATSDHTRIFFGEPEFDWYALTPSDSIIWSNCFGSQKCARLILPLDYLSSPGESPNATIALRMIPASDLNHYKGTILLNPGGPGGSGTDFVQRIGTNISRIVGGGFDILGFDPRGIGASTPAAHCFESDSQRNIWELLSRDRLLNVSDGSVAFARAREKLVGERCVEAIGGEWGVAKFMSTASVATDMLHIVERLGQKKLQYWGFSYGSVLGQYFAAMYPEKVGRVVIDGVYDSHNYRAALWNTNLADVDDVLESFFTFCHQAGAEKCPLYAATVAEIHDRYTNIFARVTNNPIAVPFAVDGPFIITATSLHQLMFLATYSPTTMFGTVANTLVAVEKNNQTALAALGSSFPLSYKCKCKEPQPWLISNEAFHAIACGDGDPFSFSPEEFSAYFTNLTSMSPFAAPIWGNLRIRCAEWPLTARWRYTGPLEAANTSHPLLVVSPTSDPVCPLSDAKAVRARYGGAGLLVQNSFGHCSLSAPSLCTAKHVRAYFENGTLPKEGTVCEVDELPFVGAVGAEKVSAMSAEDMELLDALRGLADEVPMLGNF